MDRRGFFKLTRAGLAAGALSSVPGLSVAGRAETASPELHLFSKHLQFLDYPAMAKAAATLGFAGLDLTVRPGGHVEPDHFEHDLPLAIKAIEDAGLSCVMMTSNITGAGNPRDRDLLALARSLGVTSYRLGFLRYDKDISPMDGVANHREQLAKLAEWNREIGITGLVQNHSGPDRFGAAVWDACLALQDLDPQYLGMQFDIRHAVTDGGLMLADHVPPGQAPYPFPDFQGFQVGKGRWPMAPGQHADGRRHGRFQAFFPHAQGRGARISRLAALRV